jgi:hypothetical protein
MGESRLLLGSDLQEHQISQQRKRDVRTQDSARRDDDINSRGEIAAYAFDLSNSEFHAALVIPCDEQHTDIPACNESAAAVPQTTANITVTPATGGNAKVTLPENVREQLRRRLRLARFGSGPMRLQQPNLKYEGENSHVAHGLWARGK